MKQPDWKWEHGAHTFEVMLKAFANKVLWDFEDGFPEKVEEPSPAVREVFFELGGRGRLTMHDLVETAYLVGLAAGAKWEVKTG